MKKTRILFILCCCILMTCHIVQADIVCWVEHEPGDLREYDNTITDGGDLSVSTAAALAGSNYGLQFVVDDTNQMYGLLVYNAPASNEIRLRFYFDPNGIVMADGDAFNLFHIYGGAPFFNYLLLVRFRKQGANYNIFAQPDDDDSTWPSVGSVNVTDAVHYVEVYCKRATSATAADGIFTYWVDGTQIGTMSNLDNFDRWLEADEYYFGLMTPDAGTSGTFYLDELKIIDTNEEIGPYKFDGFDDGWQYCFKYTIDNSRVGEELTEFPLHIDLTNDAPSGFWSHVYYEDGNDIRIADSDNETNLTFNAHLEGFSKAGSQGHIWVKKTIPPAGNTAYVYVYYGNHSFADPYTSVSQANTYNANYAGVWHLDEAAGTHYDGTSNNNDSTVETVTQQGADIGKINGADELSGSAQYVRMLDNASISGLAAITVEAWINADIWKPTGGYPYYEYIVGKANWSSQREYRLRYESDTSELLWFVSADGNDPGLNGELAIPIADIPAGEWHHLTGTYDSGVDEIACYLNGELVDSQSFVSGGIFNGTSNLAIGSSSDNGGNWGGNTDLDDFDGVVDEVRISNIARSAEWIEFSYLSDLGKAGKAGPEETKKQIKNVFKGVLLKGVKF